MGASGPTLQSSSFSSFNIAVLLSAPTEWRHPKSPTNLESRPVSSAHVPFGDVPGDAGARLGVALHAGNPRAEEGDGGVEVERQDGKVLRLELDQVPVDLPLIGGIDRHAKGFPELVVPCVLVAAEAGADPPRLLGGAFRTIDAPLEVLEGQRNLRLVERGERRAVFAVALLGDGEGMLLN